MANPDSSVLRKLNRVKQLVAEVAPESVENLNDGATEEQLAAVRSVLPFAPQELLQLLSLHNGEEMISWSSLFPDGMQLMTVDHLLETARYRASQPERVMENLDELVALGVMDMPFGPVRPLFTHPSRIAFAHVNAELIWSFDMEPAEGGRVGQIVYDDAEDLTLGLVAESFEDLLDKYIRDLELGVFSADDDGQIISSNGAWYIRGSNAI